MGHHKVLPATSIYDCRNYVGETFGPSEWIELDQPLINAFGKLTRDEAWHHVDVERAKEEMPGGKTIAHGLLTLAFAPHMLTSICDFSDEGKGASSLYYGYDKLRFLAPVPVGSRIRMTGEVVSAEPKPSGVLIRLRTVIELEGSDRPAMSGEQLTVGFPATQRPDA